MKIMLTWLRKAGRMKPGQKKDGKMERFGPDERYPHMIMATCFILLAISGAGIFSWYWPLPAAHSPFAIGWLHVASGSIFAICNLYFLYRWRSCMRIKEHDILWLKQGGLLRNTAQSKLPQAGRFNGGQKVLFRISMVTGLTLAATGLFILFPAMLPGVSAVWLHPLHGFLALCLTMTVIGHLYIVMWLTPGCLRSMWGDGLVDEAWMKNHHRKYYDYKTTK